MTAGGYTPTVRPMTWQVEMDARHRAGYRLVPDPARGVVWAKRVGPLTWRIAPTGEARMLR